MSVCTEEALAREQKIYARNQQTKIARYLELIQQAADLAGEGTWNFDKVAQLVNQTTSVTKQKKKAPKHSKKRAQPKVTLKYVLKDAKSATTMNRRVHAISEAEHTPQFGPRRFCGLAAVV